MCSLLSVERMKAELGIMKNSSFAIHHSSLVLGFLLSVFGGFALRAQKAKSPERSKSDPGLKEKRAA